MNKILKEREKMIIEPRYGLLNGGSKTQRERAKMLEV